MGKLFIVLRRCCNSGFCIDCHKRFDGTRNMPATAETRALVVQYLTWLPETAQRVAYNWRGYNSVVHETDSEMPEFPDGTTEESKEYVRSKLTNPQRIG